MKDYDDEDEEWLKDQWSFGYKNSNLKDSMALLCFHLTQQLF